MPVDIDFARSRAIIVATSTYDDPGLPNMPAARNSATAMRDLLVGPRCKWPKDNVSILENLTSHDSPLEKIAELIHEADDVLLLYYVGHGQLLDGEQLGLSLADTKSEARKRRYSSLKLSDLSAELHYGSKARLQLVMLDCCYSGLATKNTQGSNAADQIQVMSQIEGVYTITASRASQEARHEEGEKGLTYFGKFFTETVRRGIRGKPQFLTVKDIDEAVAGRFRKLRVPDGEVRPEPSRSTKETAQDFQFAINGAFIPPQGEGKNPYTPRKRRTRIITSEAFAQIDPISFTAQPYLKELFVDIRDNKKPLAIIVGADVSENSSLPSRQALINSMAELIEDPEIRDLALQDQSPLNRKAEIILQILQEENSTINEIDIVRDILYRGIAGNITPGQIATDIARLAYLKRGNVSLLTTNYDVLLEEALLEYFEAAKVKSFSVLDNAAAWREWNSQDGQIGVLHLNGAVSPGRPLSPVLLTETQFLRFGSRIRRAVSDSLHDSCAIFVGLSTFDSTLIGPLYEITPSGTSSYSLAVPDNTQERSTEQAAKYAISHAYYLEQRFGFRPIFLRSYSQLGQVVSDLALAIVEPERYTFEPNRPDSLVYGHRLSRALNDCYDAVGCKRNSTAPTGTSAQDLTARLRAALRLPGGPIEVLTYYAEQDNLPLNENLGLYLWLRGRDEDQDRRSYVLNLVGTSAYTHEDEWFLEHDVPIDQGSDSAAAQAVFRGAIQVAAFSESVDHPWRGKLAAPIIMTGTGSEQVANTTPVDILIVGAIVLSTTLPILDHGCSEATREYSVMHDLDSTNLNQLITSLQRAAAYAINLG